MTYRSTLALYTARSIDDLHDVILFFIIIIIFTTCNASNRSNTPKMRVYRVLVNTVCFFIVRTQVDPNPKSVRSVQKRVYLTSNDFSSVIDTNVVKKKKKKNKYFLKGEETGRREMVGRDAGGRDPSLKSRRSIIAKSQVYTVYTTSLMLKFSHVRNIISRIRRVRTPDYILYIIFIILYSLF